MWLLSLTAIVSFAFARRTIDQSNVTLAPVILRDEGYGTKIEPLTDLRVDYLEGVATTFDLTPYLQERESLLSELVPPAKEGDSVGFALIAGHPARPGVPANALIQGARPLTEGINHWRFVGLTGSFGCGFSDLERFGSGWKLDGLYLTANGNLAGRGALKVGFVRRMPEIPTVDWFFEVQGKHMDIFINVNDISYGQAFSLTFNNTTTLENLRPLLTFQHDTDETYHVLVYQFTTLEPTPEVTRLYQTPTLTTLRYTKWTLQDDPTASLMITESKVTLKVANVISCQADFMEDGLIKVKSNPISTRLLPPENLRKLETIMIKMLTTLRAWNMDGDVLHIDSDIGVTTWIKAQDTTPVADNPFVTE